MKEQLVSFKVAKLAKEKGFNVKTEEYFSSDTKVTSVSYNEYPAPTQSLLQKWLREEHSIHIEILLTDDSPYDKFYYRTMEVGKYFSLSHSENLTTYEEALEEGLKEGLMLIKK